MTDELVSIVVAVYNNKEDLDRCVQSILNQTYPNIELILVTDKPTDGSEEMCREYAARDSRIKLIVHEENQGITAAWRDGVSVATGKYLGFVDADDYLDLDLYQQMMACRADFDLVVCRWWREEESKKRIAQDILNQGAYTTEEDMNFLLENLISTSVLGGETPLQIGIFPLPGSKLFKTAILQSEFNAIREDAPTSSDLVFFCRYMLQCKSALITDICGYHYQIRSGSTSRSVSIDRSTRNARGVYNALAPLFLSHPRADVLLPQLQIKVAALLKRAPIRMGFPPEAQNKTLVFPFMNLLDDKRIILCGAGAVGQDYWRQIRRLHMCEIGLWVDKRWEYRRREGLQVSPPEELAQCAYDYVVIAVYRQELAEEIKKDLLAMGVAEEKILWRAPVVF